MTKDLKDLSLYFHDHLDDFETLEALPWPHNPFDFEVPLKAWVDDLLEYAASLKDENPAQRSALSFSERIVMNIPYWQMAFMNVAHTLSLAQGLPPRGYRPVAPKEKLPFWHAFLQRKPLPDMPYTRALVKGVAHDPMWKNYARMVKHRLTGHSIPFVPFGVFKPEIHVICTTVFRALENYTKDKDKNYAYMPAESWFGQVNVEGVTLSEQESHILQHCLNRAYAHLEKFVDADEQLYAWFARQLQLSFIGLEAHAQFAQSHVNKRPLPQTLIAGVGAPWNTILRALVFKDGGDVSIFDHGSSAVLGSDMTHYIVNLNHTNRFISFSQDNIATYKQGLPAAITPFVKGCALEVQSMMNAPVVQPQGDVSKQLKIICIPFNFCRDRAFPIPFPHDVILLDFNHKLLGALQELGHEVLYKPHPAFLEITPDEAQEHFGCTMSLDNLENVLADADLVVTCDPLSSTITSIIMSGKPAVIFDYRKTLNPLLNADFQDRLEVVDLGYNDLNHMDMAWDNLAQYIANSLGKANSQAMHRYFINE